MSQVKTFNQGNFEAEVLKSSTPVLVDFWAPWCAPCRMMAPILDQLSTEMGDKLVIGKVDVEDPANQQLAMQYQIQSIPNMKLFKDGKVIREYVGLRDKETFAAELGTVL